MNLHPLRPTSNFSGERTFRNNQTNHNGLSPFNMGIFLQFDLSKAACRQLNFVFAIESFMKMYFCILFLMR